MLYYDYISSKTMIKKIIDDLCENYYKLCKYTKRKKITAQLLKSIPNSFGVYLFYQKGQIIYVGRANDLHHRIVHNHLSKGKHGKTSSFQVKLHNKTKIPFNNIGGYIKKNLELKYIEVPDYDSSILLEALLIKQWRGRKKHKLLNNEFKD